MHNGMFRDGQERPISDFRSSRSARTGMIWPSMENSSGTARWEVDVFQLVCPVQIQDLGPSRSLNICIVLNRGEFWLALSPDSIFPLSFLRHPKTLIQCLKKESRERSGSLPWQRIEVNPNAAWLTGSAMLLGALVPTLLLGTRICTSA